MNGMNNSWVKKWLVPLTVACCVMALVLLTVPITGIPATRVGGYGGGGGGGSVGAVGLTGVTVVGTVNVGCPGTTTVMISAPNATMVDPLSVTFAGMPVQSWSYDVNGNLVLVFNTCNCNLRPGNTLALLTGKFINGAPFSQTVAVVVQ